MPPKSQAPLAPADQALIDRAQPEKLVSLKKKDLNELLRTLRGRRDELGDAQPDQRRPIVKALRRAAEERRARVEDVPPKPKKPGKDKAEVAAPPQPVAEVPQPEPAPKGGDKPSKAEREARKQQKEAERAAKKEANKTGRKGGKAGGSAAD